MAEGPLPVGSTRDIVVIFQITLIVVKIMYKDATHNMRCNFMTGPSTSANVPVHILCAYG
jgi:hypothetical protein